MKGKANNEDMSQADLNSQVVARVRDAADVLEVVGDHVRLKKKGRRWEGLCPFHEEKTPSFSVDPEKGLYHCFGCRAGGDIINFIMQLENLSFPEAVEGLARRYGVELPAKNPEQRRRQHEADRVRTLLEEAQHWYRERLRGPDAAAARGELRRRGFEEEHWNDFGFGFAPDDWRALLTDLSKRHPEGSIVGAGLAVMPERGNRPYDRFRKRITFPIRGADGRLVAFGGRILGEGEPKYLNSPESVVFSKRHTLFCLDRARKAISESGEVLVVEGYFDCLSLHKVGLRQAVATLGTALTADHARLLRRLLGPDGRVVLCYDADPAGLRAAEAGARVLLEAAINVSIVVIEGGKDPDDIIRDHGVEAMLALVENSMPVLKFLLRDLPSDPRERRREGLKLSALVCAASDPAIRRNLVEELARELYLRPHEIEEQGRQPRSRAAEAPKRRVIAAPGELYLARILLECSPAWRVKVVDLVDSEGIEDLRVRTVFAMVKDMLKDDIVKDDTVNDMDKDKEIVSGDSSTEERFDVMALCEHLDESTRSLVAELVNSDLPEITEETIIRHLGVVLDRQARYRARQIGPMIEEAEQKGDNEEVRRLLAEKDRLRWDFPKF